MSTEASTESMSVETAKEKFLNGKLTGDDASSIEPDSNGHDMTFLCEDGYFVVTQRVVETNVNSHEDE